MITLSEALASQVDIVNLLLQQSFALRSELQPVSGNKGLEVLMEKDHGNKTSSVTKCVITNNETLMNISKVLENIHSNLQLS